MSKPENYEEICLILRNIPYQFEDEHFKGMSINGGGTRQRTNRLG
jgi:hypothetical protein